MAKNLVIVESPAKAQTIKKFLGKEFEVKSSYGHIRDLPKNKLGIDKENEFEPQYIISTDKTKIVKELKESTKEAEIVWLATDEDREGEAIAWHLYETLNLKNKENKRIAFHEITKEAINKAIKNPREINFNLVNAQQARRVIDRLVGYELSELLWKKVKGAMSAGRVQSVAVKLIVEKEEEINKFDSDKFFKITSLLEFSDKKGEKYSLKSEITDKIKKKEEAYKILENFAKSEFKVIDIKQKDGTRKPAPPFTTSTLQQEANRKLGYSVSRTMQLAQNLYEAGKITYMRTDSTNLSEEAQSKIKNFIINNFDEKYFKPRQYKTKVKNAQEAHEAIRPTEMKLKVSDDSSEQKLYELIFYRTIASQMSEAIVEKTTLTIEASEDKHNLVSTAEVIKFDGFLKIYNFKDLETDEVEEATIPKISVGQILQLCEALANEKMTIPPYRYNEASLVSKLEELGIGRPSTYAPIISTIVKRKYVEKKDIQGTEIKLTEIKLKNGKISEKDKKDFLGKERNKFKPTDIGVLVTNFLKQYFTNIVDYSFTAKVEEEFDEIANGNQKWTKLIKEFYKDFNSKLTHTLQTAEKVTGQRLLGQHPESKENIYVKIAKYGPVIQIGEFDEDKKDQKPKYQTLPSDYSIETITLEQALKVLNADQNGRLLGNDPKTGRPIYARNAKYGPVIQIGSYDDKEKPQFIKLLKGMNVDTITLEQALSLSSLPRELGLFEGKKVTADIGRFGPYVKWDNIFASLKSTDSPLMIDLQRAIELIEEKKKKDSDKIIKEFSTDFKIIKDRWGKPTIFHKKKYYKIPKGTDADNLSEKDCLKIIEESK